MSYKIGDLPSPEATLCEIADFLEYQCFVSEDGIYSSTQGESAMGISYDSDFYSGDDSRIDEALSVIENRLRDSGNKYPFDTSTRTLQLRADVNFTVKEVYKFLLLATRANMSTHKIAGQLDGTALFEQLCSIILGNYFGNNCKSSVFGTGQQGGESFKNRVQSFLDKLNEGDMKFRNPDNDNHHQKDGKVDIIAFIPFADTKKGQFIAFGQCKTGTNWRTSVSQMQPKSFCMSFFSPQPGFIPIIIFMVAESFTDDWEYLARNSGGILFDRTRIMNFLPDNIDNSLLSNIVQWNHSVIERQVNIQ